MRDVIAGEIRKPLLLLVGGVIILFLVAVANVSTLQLARAAHHEHESAIRFTLGASKRQVVVPVLAEAVLLAGSGAALGSLLAAWTVPALLSAYGPRFPDIGPVHLDGTAIVGAFLLAAVASLAIGIVPAIKIREPARLAGYGDAAPSRYGAFARSRAAAALVVAQVALTLVLLTATGLLVTSFLTLTRSERGYDAARIAFATITLPRSGYGTSESTLAFADLLLERTEALPGVDGAAITTGLPVFFGQTETGTAAAQPDRTPVLLQTWGISDDYFRVLGMPLVQGRSFSPSRRSAEAVVIDRTAARLLVDTDAPLGERVTLASSGRGVTIIGVVGDVTEFAFGPSRSTASSVEPHLYTSLAGLMTPFRRMHVVIRAAHSPSDLVLPLRDMIHAIDPDVVVEVRTLQGAIDLFASRERLLAFASLGFGVLAFVLAVSGVFALLTYSTSLRHREIGLRMALGGQPAHVVKMVLRQGLRLTALGILIGFPLAWALRALLATLLVDVPFINVGIPIGASLAMLAAGALASYLPANRATHVDPLLALKGQP